jgi:hypothetical protein
MGRNFLVTYLLLGPGQLALQLLLLVEERLVLSAQRRETLRKLVSQLRDILLCLIAHGCAGAGQGGGVGGCVCKRLRCQARKKRGCAAGKEPRSEPERARPLRYSFRGPLDTASALRLSSLCLVYVASYETRSFYTACRPFRDFLAVQFHRTPLRTLDHLFFLQQSSLQTHRFFAFPRPSTLRAQQFLP